jgi:hypothetical protein
LWCFFDPGLNWVSGRTVFEQDLGDHLVFLEHLCDVGTVVMAGPFGDGSGGMTIFRVVNGAELNSLLGADPGVVAGVLVPRVRAWKPMIEAKLHD